MGKIENYRQYIQQLLKEYAQGRSGINDEVEMQTVFLKKYYWNIAKLSLSMEKLTLNKSKTTAVNNY